MNIKKQTKSKPSRRPNGAIKNLSAALGIGTRQVSALLKRGMPIDAEAAIQWREDQATIGGKTDSAEELRQARIRVLKQQERKAKIEADREEGKLISRTQVYYDSLKASTIIRNALLRLTNDLPGKLAGLSEAQIQRELHTVIHALLQETSDRFKALYEESKS